VNGTTTRDEDRFCHFRCARRSAERRRRRSIRAASVRFPFHQRWGPMIVITVWAARKDLWNCGPPIGLCSDYRPTTQAGSTTSARCPMSSTSPVRLATATCASGEYAAFNLWALTTLASFPKGSNPSDFKLTPPPEGYSCKLGRFTDTTSSARRSRGFAKLVGRVSCEHCRQLSFRSCS